MGISISLATNLLRGLGFKLYLLNGSKNVTLRWFGMLKDLFAIFAIFSYIKPISPLITLVPKNIYLTVHNKKNTSTFVTACHSVNNVLI